MKSYTLIDCNYCSYWDEVYLVKLKGSLFYSSNTLKSSSEGVWLYNKIILLSFGLAILLVKLDKPITLVINQAFANCVHGYERARNVHANGVTCAQNSMQGTDWQHNWELLIACQYTPLSFKKIPTTTTTAFLIFNTVDPNPDDHSTAFDHQSFAPFLKFQVRLIDLS